MISLRPRRSLAALAGLALVASACSGSDAESDSSPGATSGTAADSETEASADSEGGVTDDGFVDEAWFQARTDDYLEFATEELNPSSINNVVAHAARASREPGFDWEADSVTVESFGSIFDEIDDLKDTTDSISCT